MEKSTRQTATTARKTAMYKTYLKDNCRVTLDHITFGYTSEYNLLNPSDCIRLHRDIELCESNQPELLDTDFDIAHPDWGEFGVEYPPSELSKAEWQNFYWDSLTTTGGSQW